MSISRAYIRPNTSAALQYHSPLRGSDHGYLFIMDVPFALVFPHHHLNESLLKEALVFTLNEFPSAAGRIVHERKSYLAQYLSSALAISVKDSEGVIFESEDVNNTMPDEDAHASVWTRYFCATHQRTKKEAIGVPLLSIRLSHFNSGGSVLCVNFAHVLADASAAQAFMQTWSYYCGVLSGHSNYLPNQRPAAPILERPISNIGELQPKDISERVTKCQAFSAGLKIMAVNILDELVDFRVSAAHIKSLKQNLLRQLPETKWLSSFEVLMSYLLRAMTIAEKKDQAQCHCVINIRGRSKIAPLGYFGNAISYHSFIVEGSGQVSDAAAFFHHSLRQALADEESLSRAHIAAERYLQEGCIDHFFERSRWLKPFYATIHHGDFIINSWAWSNFNWFDMDFGLNGQRPSYFRVAPHFRHHRHIHVFPASIDGQVMIRVQLPKRSMQGFRLALKILGLSDKIVEIKRK